MSIPQRFYRIARYKLTELKEQFDKLDEEALTEQSEKLARGVARTDAHQELRDAMATPAQPPTAASNAPAPQRRTPDEIARGLRPGTAGSTLSAPPAAAPATTAQADPLLYHYKQLGLPEGSDFTAVQAAYNRLAARCDASRFPAGSEDARLAADIRARLDTSYKVLRDALDPTARRFDMLEFDTPPQTSS
jgi:hypothetical protein